MMSMEPLGIIRVRRPAGYHSLTYLRPASEYESSSDITSSNMAILAPRPAIWLRTPAA